MQVRGLKLKGSLCLRPVSNPHATRFEQTLCLEFTVPSFPCEVEAFSAMVGC